MPLQQLETRSAAPATVAVVDPRPGDYDILLDAPLGTEMRWQFLTCGRDALRLCQLAEVDLWVIHLTLPDMSGLELCEMLRTRPPIGGACLMSRRMGRPVIYVVSDDYRTEDERAARARGASLFGCKPVQAWWFEPWIRPPGPGRPDPEFADSSILHFRPRGSVS